MQSVRGRPTATGLAILLTVIGFTRPLDATPFIPERDADVLERLPTTLGGDAGELRRLRNQLARAPTDVAQAVAVAGRYIELGQSQTDPRYYGYAQAALAPWWGLPDPPPEVLLLRAAIRQSRHEFDLALQDLSRLLEKDPRDPRAWLMQAVIFIVRADHRAARQACEALARLRRAFLAFSCMGSLASLSGQAEGGYGLLVLAKGQSHGATPAERVRLETLLGKTAERMGDRQRAEAHFQEARRLGPHDAYLLGAYADFLLDQGRAGEVVALLREETRVDGLLLRLTLAEREIGAPGRDAHVEELRARFAASRQRGDSLHQGEEARFLLHLVDQPQAALTLAQANWAVQREPRDARILLEAALAAARRRRRGRCWRWMAARPNRGRRPEPAGGAAGKRRLMMRSVLAVALLLLATGPAAAHKPSDAYLRLALGPGAAPHGSLDVALRDLELVVGLDGNGDGAITWGELKARHAAIAAYVQSRLVLDTPGGPCELRRSSTSSTPIRTAPMRSCASSADCPAAAGGLTLRYGLLFDVDPMHRGLLTVSGAGAVSTAVLSPDRPEIALEGRRGAIRGFGPFFTLGLEHIAFGFDHLLFLLVLLLPAVYRRAPGGGWLPVTGWSPAAIEIVKVLTAFTLAHGISLAAATTGMVDLPARLVESAIAATIVLAALDNIWPCLPAPTLADRVRLRPDPRARLRQRARAARPAAARPRDRAARLQPRHRGRSGRGRAALPRRRLLAADARPTRAGLLPVGSAAALVLACFWFIDRAFAGALTPF